MPSVKSLARPRRRICWIRSSASFASASDDGLLADRAGRLNSIPEACAPTNGPLECSRVYDAVKSLRCFLRTKRTAGIRSEWFALPRPALETEITRRFGVDLGVEIVLLG